MREREHNNSQRVEQAGQLKELSVPLNRNRCQLNRIELRFPDKDYQDTAAQVEDLRKALAAFGFNFKDESAAREVSAAFITALIAETRLNEDELFKIQEALSAAKDLHAGREDGQLNLLGISIKCEGGVDIDPLPDGQCEEPAGWQRIRLAHVEILSQEDMEESWRTDPDFWKRDNEEQDDLDSLLEEPEIEELEEVTLLLEYDPDPEDPAIYCSFIVEDEFLVAEHDKESWKSADSFVEKQDFPVLPEFVDDSWTVEQIDNIPGYRISKGRCVYEVSVVDFTAKLPESEEIVPAEAQVDQDLPPEHFSMCNPPEYALRKLFRDLGLSEVEEIMRAISPLAETEDNPHASLGSAVKRYGGGVIAVEERHVVLGESVDSTKLIKLSLDSSPIGVVEIEISMGMMFNLTIYPPTRSQIERAANPEKAKAQYERAAAIRWQDIRSFAKEFPPLGKDDEFDL